MDFSLPKEVIGLRGKAIDRTLASMPDEGLTENQKRGQLIIRGQLAIKDKAIKLRRLVTRHSGYRQAIKDKINTRRLNPVVKIHDALLFMRAHKDEYDRDWLSTEDLRDIVGNKTNIFPLLKRVRAMLAGSGFRLVVESLNHGKKFSLASNQP